MPTSRRDHNVILQLPSGARKPSGKIVDIGTGYLHFHVTAQSGWRLVSAGAWGLQEDVLAHCETCGVGFVHIYDKGEGATYTASLPDIYGPTSFAVPGYNREWGQMQNLEERFWRRTEGRVAASRIWVPDAIAEVIVRHVTAETSSTATPGDEVAISFGDGSQSKSRLAFDGHDEPDDPAPTQALLPL